MNTRIQTAKAILGNELVQFFQETCGNANELEEAINEALRAFRIIRHEMDWTNISQQEEL